jgi:non-lysosomal glucosylceramidase
MLRSSKQARFDNFEVANGLRRDGTPLDPNGTHPLEVWTGINFGIASCFQLMDKGQKLEAIFVVVNLGESVAS